MDNLTHSLVGALLGQMGLKRRTGLAMPTLIIGANIPDIDASCTVLGMVSLAMRRGVTHGPIAMLVLPAVLAAAMIALDRWQTRRGTRPPGRLPVRPGWLLALAFIGCVSHPFFDWLNSYGVRLLEPFSHRWFYGDALFIVDPWLLAMLTAGSWLSLRREQRKRGDWRRPAWAAAGGVSSYILLNFAISADAVAQGSFLSPHSTMIVANPVPLTFWRRDVLTRTSTSFLNFRTSPYKLLEGPRPIIRRYRADDRPVIRTPQAKAFLFWSRMPVVEQNLDGRFFLQDQRFMGSPTAGRFAVELEPRP